MGHCCTRENSATNCSSFSWNILRTPGAATEHGRKTGQSKRSGCPHHDDHSQLEVGLILGGFDVTRNRRDSQWPGGSQRHSVAARAFR